MDLPTRSIWKIRSSVDSAGRRVTLAGVAATLKFSNSEIREVIKAWGQIESNPSDDVASGGRRAGSGVPGNHNLREASEGEGEADRRLHLGSDADGEDDADVGCH